MQDSLASRRFIEVIPPIAERWTGTMTELAANKLIARFAAPANL